MTFFLIILQFYCQMLTFKYNFTNWDPILTFSPMTLQLYSGKILTFLLISQIYPHAISTSFLIILQLYYHKMLTLLSFFLVIFFSYNPIYIIS